jgi:hypothetical protein
VSLRAPRVLVRAPLRASVTVFVAAACGLVAAGCTVGDGSGSAVGMLMDVGCNSSASLDTPKPFSLNPSFFAGEPIEDVCPSPPGNCSTSSPHMNRLLIKIQRTGNRPEVNDVLYFDVLNSLKVGECVRGRTANGAPTWDTRVLTSADGTPIPDMPWCVPASPVAAGDGGAPDAGATDAGGADAGGADAGGAIAPMPGYARINISTQDYVQASLAPLYTCVEARSVAVALPGSWIEFQAFGSAIQSNIADPEQRDDLSKNGDFKVEFGQRLQASFHLVLGDQAVEYAIKTHSAIPDLRISGYLDGTFDFDLERGRAAQPFP